MSLSAALSAARSSLATTANQTSVISRNISGASEPLYTRKSAVIATFGGGVRVESIGRAANPTLFNNMLGATSQAAGQQVIVDGLEQLERTVGDPESNQSPAAMLGKLRDTIQQYTSTPDDSIMAQAVLDGARDMAESLHSATAIAQQARQQADADMVGAVERINTLLSRFETVNTAVVNGTQAGVDVTDTLDTRDRILAQLSEEVGIRIVSRAHDDYVLYTDSGVTLFETKARTVSLEPTQGYQPSTVGKAVHVDGVPVAGGSTAMPVKSGRLAGLAAVRDEIAVTYQNQLDEIARGLVEVFAESDQNDPPNLATIPGLFTYSGAPALPASGMVVAGLAADLRVNPNANPDEGGALNRLRDGGIGDPSEPAYVYNTSGASGYTGRLQDVLDKLVEKRSFDPAAGADPANDLVGFASSSISWLEASRQSASGQVNYQRTLLERTSEALSNATGVNIDEEMTIMLELERSYQASAKLIATVDAMLTSLMNAVR